MKCAKGHPLETKSNYRSIIPEYDFYTISIDVVGPLTESTTSCKFLIVAIEKLAKWVEAVHFGSAAARVNANFILNNILTLFM